MSRLSVSLLVVLMLFSFSGCDQISSLFNPPQKEVGAPVSAFEAEVEGTPLALINGRTITLEDFSARIEAFNAEIQGSKDIPDSVKQNYLINSLADREELLERMIEKELIVAEAIERSLDKDKDVQAAMKALKEQLLFARIIESERTKAAVSAKEVENYYNIYKDVFKVPEERRVSLIVVSGEDKAKEIMIALLQGADFSTSARTNSTHRSASNGGDIGFIVQKSPLTSPDKQTSFEKLEQVAFSLELNQPSAIFKGPDGYYIIKVTELKASRERLLSEVYNDIEQGLSLKAQEEGLTALIGNLRRSANIIIYDQLLKE
ncbi:MAG: peptidyl-prolyl cis-trans isomerase [Candidatus Omnitrophica bacterium]|nr:peptidyl-prolyl cis-trans isomerase [Candidatus Omnitrophota bacterium]